jgi:hypothetical protein
MSGGGRRHGLLSQLQHLPFQNRSPPCTIVTLRWGCDGTLEVGFSWKPFGFHHAALFGVVYGVYD